MSHEPLAYFWLLSSITGLLIGGRAVRRSTGRRRLAEQLPENDPERDPMISAARSHVRREGIRLTIQLVAFAIGIGAVFNVPWVARLIGPALVFVIQWGAVANSWLDERAFDRQAQSYTAIRVRTAQQLMGAAIEAEKEGE